MKWNEMHGSQRHTHSPSHCGVNFDTLVTTQSCTCLRQRRNHREPKSHKQNISKTGCKGVVICREVKEQNPKTFTNSCGSALC